MQPDNNKKNKQKNSKLTPEIYDLYSPPVYGKILSIVHKGPRAGKILEKIFFSAYTKDKTFPLRSPLMSLIDLAHEKSTKTVEALTIVSACCSGSTVSISPKK